MKRYLLLIACTFFGVSAFALPTLENKDGEFFFSNDGCATAKKPKKEPSRPRTDVALLLEAKGGYFFFNDHKMNKVYNNGGFDVQLALSGRVWKWIQLYGALEYIQCSGKSLGAGEPTKIQIVPLSFGLKPSFPIAKWLDYYLNIGPRYFFIMQSNTSKYVNENVDENGLGGFVGTGFLFHLNRRLILDAYGEYSYFSRQFSSFRQNVEGHTKDVGGFSFGGGLGYSF